MAATSAKAKDFRMEDWEKKIAIHYHGCGVSKQTELLASQNAQKKNGADDKDGWVFQSFADKNTNFDYTCTQPKGKSNVTLHNYDWQARDAHINSSIEVIQRRKDPGCPCCLCCGPKVCGGKEPMFGGKELSELATTHRTMHIGHNGSYFAISNTLYWQIKKAFKEFGIKVKADDETGAVSLEKATDEDEKKANGCCADGKVETVMIYQDIIKAVFLNNDDKLVKDLTPDSNQINLDKVVTSQEEFDKKWINNPMMKYEITGEHYSVKQTGRIMTHDDRPFYWCHAKILAAVEYHGGVVTEDQFFAILGVQQRSCCGRCLCCICDACCPTWADEEQCPGCKTCCNLV